MGRGPTGKAPEAHGSARRARTVAMSENRREPERVWVTPPAPDLMCSVCTEVFTDPVTLACGHSFCRACAVSWFDASAKRCPVARCPASANARPATLPPQYALKGMVEALRVHCRFGVREGDRGNWTHDRDGCQAHLLIADVSAHEASCEYAPELCPFSGCGVERRRRDARAHDTAAAEAHAFGERNARLASEAAASARVAAIEARLAAAESAAAGGSSAARVATGATLRATLAGHTGQLYACAWSPDGATVVSGGSYGQMKLWNATTLQCIATLNGRAGYPYYGTVYDCSWSPDGLTIAAGSSDKKLKLWNVEERSCVKTMTGHANAVFSVAWNPLPGRLLASAGGDFKLWDADTGRCVCTLADPGPEKQYKSCAWSPDSRTVLLGSEDGNVSLWDLATCAATGTLAGHANLINALAWKPDGSSFVSASDDQSLKLWSVAAGSWSCSTLSGHNNTVECCAWSKDGGTIVSCSKDRTLRLWNAATCQECCAPIAAVSPSVVFGCAWSPDGRVIACCGFDKTVTLFDVQR